MKKLLLHLGLLFLLLLPLLGRAQEIQVGGRIIDAETKKPVPFASISLLKARLGVLSSDSGYFNLNGLTELEQDSLIVMHVGYFRFARAVKPRINHLSPNARAVTPRLNDLPPIELCPIIGESNKRVSRGKRVGFYDTYLTPKKQEIIKNTEYAVLFKPKNSNSLKAISTLHYYVEISDLYTVVLNIHFYKVDVVKHFPTDELLSIKAIVKGPSENNWHSLDLRKYKALMPEEGCFISVKVSYQEEGFPLADTFVNYVAPTGELILPPLEKKRYIVQERAPGKHWKQTGYYSDWYSRGIKLELD